jgi:hypothetical protein
LPPLTYYLQHNQQSKNKQSVLWLAEWLVVEVCNKALLGVAGENCPLSIEKTLLHGDSSHLTTVNLNQVHTFRAPAQAAVGLSVSVIVHGR